MVANLLGRARAFVGVGNKHPGQDGALRGLDAAARHPYQHQMLLSLGLCRESKVINLPTTDRMGNGDVDISSPGRIIDVRVEIAVWLKKV